ncbi:DNA polymerase III subunit [Butyrivibrio sp. MB2005]|uniref:DNA polymerase III subunit n=1 Tax=Butyrivibrio sp. MB2005 TaxID=1280678 RepID=UPI0003FCF759|nr:DNA polymerase III subunit [Butyrivibrio sp. MB2005]
MAHFADIIDQGQIVEHMQNALRTGKISHAYIISGDVGSGKKLIADTFSKAILCENRKDDGKLIESCDECHSCNQTESGSHPDIRKVTHEKATIGVDDIRQQVCDDVYIKPYSDHKIYIIPEAEKMTVQAQNALLKTLEEPPAYAVIIILTANIDAFLPTILSRCIVFQIKPVRDDLLMKYLMEKRKIVDYKARLSVSFAQGNIGKAILLSESEEFERLKNGTIDLLSRMERLTVNEIADRMSDMLITGNAVEESDDSDTEEKKAKATSKKPDPVAVNNYLDILLFLGRDFLVYKAEDSAEHLIFADKLSYISSVTTKCTYKQIGNMIKAVDEARSRIKANVNVLLTLEMLMLNIKENL